MTESTWGAWSPDHGAVGTETKTPALRIPLENLKSKAEGAEVGALGFLWERQGSRTEQKVHVAGSRQEDRSRTADQAKECRFEHHGATDGP